MSSYGQRPITQEFILDMYLFQAGKQSYSHLLLYLSKTSSNHQFHFLSGTHMIDLLFI